MRILDELGAELLRAARAAEDAERESAAPPRRRAGAAPAMPAADGGFAAPAADAGLAAPAADAGLAAPARARRRRFARRPVLRARARRRRSLALPRAAVFGVLAALGLAAAAAAAGLLIGRGDPIPGPPRGSVPRELQPVPGTERLNGLDVPDPDGGPPWDVRTSRSRTGAVCASIGQVLDGQFGLVGLDRRFRVLPAGAADTCSTAQPTGATLAGARALRGGGRMSDLTVVNGVASPGVTRAVAVGDGRTVALQLGPARAFLAVFRGTPEQVRPRVVLTDASGHRTTLRFADSGEYLAPDPSGGAPWTVTKAGRDCIVAKREPGPDSPTPAPKGVFNTLTSAVPARCGEAFATAQRFVPDARPHHGFRWGYNVARTVVWGAAPPGSEVVLRGAGAPRTIAVDRRTHGFAAVLDGHTDPGALRVTIDGRPAPAPRGRRGQPLPAPTVPAWRSVAAAERGTAIPQVYLPQRSSAAVVLHAPDPAGGRAWALRTWKATLAPHIKAPGGYGRAMVCFEAGIDAGGGKLVVPTGAGRTAPVRSSLQGVCDFVGRLRSHVGGFEVQPYVDDPTAPAPRVNRVVVAGMLGAGTRSAELIGAGAPRPLELGANGTFLALLGPGAAGKDIRVREVGADGRERTSKVYHPFTRCTAKREAKIADPAGGAPWVAGVGPTGCAFVARDIGGRNAWSFNDLGYITYGNGIGWGGSGRRVTARRPIVASLEPLGHPQSDDPTPAQVARRTLPGYTTINGAARSDVSSITIRTPRDVRTVRPVAGAFLAVYDGAFYGGAIVLTAHLRNGHSYTIHLPHPLY